MFNCIFKVINFAIQNNLLILRCVPFLSLVCPIILRVADGLVDCLDKIINIAFHVWTPFSSEILFLFISFKLVKIKHLREPFMLKKIFLGQLIIADKLVPDLQSRSGLSNTKQARFKCVTNAPEKALVKEEYLNYKLGILVTESFNIFKTLTSN